jgi:drug/metabolite transporter (DMT)-like permease
MTRKNHWFHLMALLTVVIWGTTYISTKVLIGHGLRPSEIFFYRFLLAYGCIWFFSRQRIWAESFRDEMLLLLAGLTGGSFYFLFENTALTITLASNVALILCTATILTAL